MDKTDMRSKRWPTFAIVHSNLEVNNQHAPHMVVQLAETQLPNTSDGPSKVE
jgi:hypothetical protein